MSLPSGGIVLDGRTYSWNVRRAPGKANPKVGQVRHKKGTRTLQILEVLDRDSGKTYSMGVDLDAVFPDAAERIIRQILGVDASYAEDSGVARVHDPNS